MHRKVMVLLTFNGRYGVYKDVAQLHLSLLSADVERSALLDPDGSAVFVSSLLVLDKAVKRFFLVFDWHETVPVRFILLSSPITVYENFCLFEANMALKQRNPGSLGTSIYSSEWFVAYPDGTASFGITSG
jgi:hypothetical protein